MKPHESIYFYPKRNGRWGVYKRYHCVFLYLFYIYTKSRKGYILFSLQFVWSAVCVFVCVSGSACEQNSSRTDEQIWTQFSRNGCFSHSKPVKLGDLGSKVKVIVTQYPFFIILCKLSYLVSQLSYVRSKWNSVCLLDIPLVVFCLNFIKN